METSKAIATLLALCLLGAPSAATAGPLPVDAGLTLHLDASAITTLPDGAAVESWADISGNGYIARQPDPFRQPTYQAAGIGGVPSVHFSGPTVPQADPDSWGDMMVVHPGDTGSDPLEAQEIFVVTAMERPVADLGKTIDGCCVTLLSGRGEQHRIGAYWSDELTLMVESYNNPFTDLDPNVPNDGGEILINGVDNSTGTDPKVVHTLDGPPMILDLAGVIPKTFNDLIIAANNDPPQYDGGRRVWHGPIGEIIMYDRVLTDDERGAVGYYLEEKYGLDTAYEPQDVIPEPATMCMLGLAVAGLGGYVRRRRKLS